MHKAGVRKNSWIKCSVNLGAFYISTRNRNSSSGTGKVRHTYANVPNTNTSHSQFIANQHSLKPQKLWCDQVNSRRSHYYHPKASKMILLMNISSCTVLVSCLLSDMELCLLNTATQVFLFCKELKKKSCTLA